MTPHALDSTLHAWDANVGRPFPAVTRRSIGALPSFGEHTQSYLAQVSAC